MKFNVVSNKEFSATATASNNPGLLDWFFLLAVMYPRHIRSVILGVCFVLLDSRSCSASLWFDWVLPLSTEDRFEWSRSCGTWSLKLYVL
jgi:hypothetical protein